MLSNYYEITKRLELQSYNENDGEYFFQLLTNPLVNYFLGAPQFLSQPNLLKNFLRQMSLHYNNSNPWLLYSIFDKKNHKLIGGCGIKVEKKGKSAEIFYLFLPEYWGKGLAVEACSPILVNIFRYLDLHFIDALILPENFRAQRVASKLNFRYVKLIDLVRYGQKNQVQIWRLKSAEVIGIDKVFYSFQ